MEAYLQTRGRRRADDYRFLASDGPQPWWTRYRDSTQFEHPTILVHSDGDRWQVYMSGIPSRRTDSENTVIRYTIVLEGAPRGEPETGAELALSMVSAWLADLVGDPTEGLVKEALDLRFTREVVDRLYHEPGQEDELRRRLAEAAADLPPAAWPQPESWPNDWLGTVWEADARRAFLCRAAQLLGGEPGRALYLNVRATPEEAGRLIGPGEPMTGVLVDDADWRGSAVVELKKKRIPPPPPPPPPPPTDRRIVLLAVAGGVTLLAIFLAWEAWQRIRGR